MASADGTEHELRALRCTTRAESPADICGVLAVHLAAYVSSVQSGGCVSEIRHARAAAASLQARLGYQSWPWALVIHTLDLSSSHACSNSENSSVGTVLVLNMRTSSPKYQSMPSRPERKWLQNLSPCAACSLRVVLRLCNLSAIATNCTDRFEVAK